jgi:hypothetical protein
MNTFQHLLAYLQQAGPGVAGGPSVDAFTRALFRDLAREPTAFGDKAELFSPPEWRPHSRVFLDVDWLKNVLERFSWFAPETVEVRAGQLRRIDGGASRLGRLLRPRPVDHPRQAPENLAV